jgi:hypothetical protein
LIGVICVYRFHHSGLLPLLADLVLSGTIVIIKCFLEVMHGVFHKFFHFVCDI